MKGPRSADGEGGRGDRRRGEDDGRRDGRRQNRYRDPPDRHGLSIRPRPPDRGGFDSSGQQRADHRPRHQHLVAPAASGSRPPWLKKKITPSLVIAKFW